MENSWWSIMMHHGYIDLNMYIYIYDYIRLFTDIQRLDYDANALYLCIYFRYWYWYITCRTFSCPFMPLILGAVIGWYWMYYTQLPETIFTGNCFDSTCFRVRRACHSYVWKALELRASIGWKISASRSFKPRQVWNTPTCVSFWIWKATVEIFAFQPPFSVDAMFQVVSALVDSCWKPKKRRKKSRAKSLNLQWLLSIVYFLYF